MPLEKPTEFDETIFTTQLEALLAEWRKLWSPIANGTEFMPMWIKDRMDDPEDIERLDLAPVVPQQEAIDRTIDYIAEMLLLAGEKKREEEAYGIIEKLFARLGQKVARTYYSLILPEILKKVIRIKTSRPEHIANTQAVDTTIEATRNQLS